MKKWLIIILALAIFSVLGFALYSQYMPKKMIDRYYRVTPTVSPTDTLVGGDRDEHGCIPSAGYSWCELKQKCLRTWEEECTVTKNNGDDETESLKASIKVALIKKHGPNASNLDISVNEIVGNYSQGGASEINAGGGMWFAAKVDGVWKLVWDGNGIIRCNDLTDYPNFPVSLISECYDETSSEMVKR